MSTNTTDESERDGQTHAGETCPNCGVALGADADERDAQYIVKGPGQIARRENGELRIYEVGDPIDPTEQELKHHAGKLVRVDERGRLLDDVRPDRPLTPEEQAAFKFREQHVTDDRVSGRSGSNSDAGQDAEQEFSVSFSVAEIQDADYPRLRSMASDVSDVSGNQSASEIRQALREKVESAGGNA